MTAAIIGLLGVVITAIFGTVTAWLGYLFSELRHRREMGVKMIEIALGILAEKPDESKPLRNWAVDVLDHYSKQAEVPLTEDAKTNLRDKPLPIFADDKIFPPTVRSYPPRGLGAVGESGEIFETPIPPPAAAPEEGRS
jgi:hypothetical protein